MSGLAVRGLTVVSCVLLAAVAAAGCSAGRVTSGRPTEQACYHLAVQALHRQIVLPADPPACAGLSPAEVNMAVGRAIREVTGARPKAIARHLASLARPYLDHLVRAIPPAAPSAVAAPPGAPHAAARARPAQDLPLDLAALGAWVLTASAGLYMLAPWLVRWLARRRRRAADSATAFTLGHFGLALTGLESGSPSSPPICRCWRGSRFAWWC